VSSCFPCSPIVTVESERFSVNSLASRLITCTNSLPEQGFQSSEGGRAHVGTPDKEDMTVQEGGWPSMDPSLSRVRRIGAKSPGSPAVWSSPRRRPPPGPDPPASVLTPSHQNGPHVDRQEFILVK